MVEIKTSRLFIIMVAALLSVASVLITIFSLKSGIIDVYPYLYIIPVILIAYASPRAGVYFTIIMGWLYLGLVYMYGALDLQLLISSNIWFYIFVSLGVLISAYTNEIAKQQKFRDIFTGSQSGIFTFDAETMRILEHNKRLDHILGYGEKELDNREITVIWSSPDEMNTFLRQIRSGSAVSDAESAFLKKDGSRVWVQITMSCSRENLVTCSVADINERKRMNEELRVSEERYRVLTESSGDIIFIRDHEGRFTYMNQRGFTILGLSPEQVTGRMPSDIFPPDVAKRQQQQFLEVLTSKHPVGGELMIPIHGEPRWFHVTLMPLADGDGTIDNVMGSVRDITQRKQMEEQLRQGEQKFRDLVENISDVIISLDLEGKITYISPVIQGLYGYIPEEVVGHHFRQFIHPDDVGHTLQDFRHRRDGDYSKSELRIHAKDGTIHFISIHPRPLLSDGRIIGFNYVMADITERNQAEALIREREQRFRMAGELIPYGVWIADTAGQFTFCSESFLSLLDMKQEECRNFGWMKRLSPEDAERTKNDWIETVRTGGFWDYEYRIFDKQQTEHFVLSRGSPLRDSTGTIISFVGIHLDITDRRQYENQLEQSLREKEVIIKEVHHRVKNNMQVISGFLQLQSNYISDPESAEKLNECQRRVRSMALVHEKLYQSRHLGFINVAEYIKTLVSELQEAYVVQADIRFEVDVESININLDTAIPCGLIINELLTNALKYAFAGKFSGTVAISLHLSPDHRFTLKVSDDGVGLPATFDLASTATLGMQLVQVLVRQLGGQIEIDSRKGTSYVITFPEKF